jgi:hypothetical protein
MAESELDGYLVHALAHLALRVWLGSHLFTEYTREVVSRHIAEGRAAMRFLFDLAAEPGIGEDIEIEEAYELLRNLPPEQIVFVVDCLHARVFIETAKGAIDKRAPEVDGVAIIPAMESTWIYWLPEPYPALGPCIMHVPPFVSPIVRSGAS